MAEHDYDLYVLGGGSGGVRAARMAARDGVRVALAEKGALGGTCVNVGCVPKKLFVYSSHVSRDLEDAEAFGWRIPEASFHWPTLLANKNREIERLNGVYASLLEQAGVELHRGRARVVGPHTVEIEGRRHTATNILVAVGGHPRLPDVPGAELGITSDEIFYLEELPRHITIVGGGYIALEFAGIFHGWGAEVEVVHRGELFLRGFDSDLPRTLHADMCKKGMVPRLETEVVRVERRGERLRVDLTDGDCVETDCLLWAIGRAPNTAGLGLAKAGVELAPNGGVLVDRYSRSSVPSIWAIGDVTNRVALTPVAIHEAMCFVRTICEGEPTAPDHDTVPTAIFTQPPIGTVGLTEHEAHLECGSVTVYRSSFKPMKHSLSETFEVTLMKLVVDDASDRVVGAHMIGLDAAEIIQGVGIAVKMGATKQDFDRTMGIHPTSAEEFVTMMDPDEEASG